jgi:hypothetical protein
MGAYISGGADYAELFEWEDGNKDDEDRRGMTVVLNDNYIQVANAQHDPKKVFGVVSATPCIVGDISWESWNEKYVKDKFGQHITQNVWYMSNTVGDDRVICEADTVPIKGYTITMEQDYILNPEYDPEIQYKDRLSRKEWSAIGLVGKLRVLPDQIINPGWSKMRTINAPDGQVNEYLLSTASS